MSAVNVYKLFYKLGVVLSSELPTVSVHFYY